MTLSSHEMNETIKGVIVNALQVDAEEVTPDATLLGDLGAESIDLLDILFRIERKTGVKIKAADLAAHIQGGIPEEEFGDENGIITAEGLRQLKKVMPQIDAEALAGNLRAESILSLFSVTNLISLVESRVAVPA